jgi:two-component system, chemotaxis family, chemotaxis protein CheY
MRTLIVEDDLVSRMLLQEFLYSYGPVISAANGLEAVEAVKASLECSMPYDLICLDIMMPGMDGQEALKKIRATEEAHGIIYPNGAKIVMVTALKDMKNVKDAFYALCDGYLVKPVDKASLLKELAKLDLMK